MYHCSQVDLCHLKLNSNQGCCGSMYSWVSLFACYAFIGSLMYISAAGPSVLWKHCFMELVFWFGVSWNCVTKNCFCHLCLNGCLCLAGNPTIPTAHRAIKLFKYLCNLGYLSTEEILLQKLLHMTNRLNL